MCFYCFYVMASHPLSGKASPRWLVLYCEMVEFRSVCLQLSLTRVSKNKIHNDCEAIIQICNSNHDNELEKYIFLRSENTKVKFHYTPCFVTWSSIQEIVQYLWTKSQSPCGLTISFISSSNPELYFTFFV